MGLFLPTNNIQRSYCTLQNILYCKIIGKADGYIKDTVVILSIHLQEIEALRPYCILYSQEFYPIGIATQQDNGRSIVKYVPGVHASSH